MIYFYLLIFYMIIFISIEFLLKDLQGKYYFNHCIANSIVTYLTVNDVYLTYTNLPNFSKYTINYHAVSIIFALHFYHIIIYFKKLRFDDWLHHIIMIFCALPLALISNCGFLLGHSLFFLNGLPGAIDYFLLFLTRNNVLDTLFEKKINNYINLWLRCPGCIAHSALSIAAFMCEVDSEFIYVSNNIKYINKDYISCFLTALSTYWNGIYFMNQVVVNYNLQKQKKLILQ